MEATASMLAKITEGPPLSSTYGSGSHGSGGAGCELAHNEAGGILP